MFICSHNAIKTFGEGAYSAPKPYSWMYGVERGRGDEGVKVGANRGNGLRPLCI